MGATKGTETSIDKQDNKRGKQPNLTGQELHAFFLQLPHKVKQCLESRFKKAINDNDRTRPAINIWNANESSTSLEANLQRQMQAWKLNPSWTDQLPKIKVSVPKGSLCNLNVEVNVGLPPDAVYNIVTDPDNKRVFKNIKEVISRKVLVDEGLRQVVELEQAALWRFLWWSGIISVHVLVDQNRKDHSMKFTQLKAGFMKRFEGCWRVEPLFVDERWCHPFKPKTLADYVSCTNGKGRIGSRVSLEQLIQPAIVPPPPISWYLRGITAKTTEMLINDLLAEAARIRGILGPENSKGELGVSENQQNEYQDDELHDIKKRWALRRRHARRSLPSVRSDAN